MEYKYTSNDQIVLESRNYCFNVRSAELFRRQSTTISLLLVSVNLQNSHAELVTWTSYLHKRRKLILLELTYSI